MSSLFALWSVTGVLFEVPSGLLADALPRRLLLAVAPLFTASGFALWILAPGYAAFAAGFVLWSAGLALVSGTLQALVYDELAAVGATAAYPRLIGRSRALGSIAAVAATALAGPVQAAGGSAAVGAASVLAVLAAAPVALLFPRAPRADGSRPRRQRRRGRQAVRTALRGALARCAAIAAAARSSLGTALRDVRGTPAVRRPLLAMALLLGLSSFDEYIPLLAESAAGGLPGGGSAALVPLLVLPATALAAAGEWWAHRGRRWTAPALAAAAVLLAAGALAGHPAGMLAVGAAFGVLAWASVGAETRLQEAADGRARATVLSVGGSAAEGVALAVFGGYALGSAVAGPAVLFAAAAPLLLVAAAAAVPRTSAAP
ncbi:MFS transporter [Nocardiopsis coralliicola]